MRKNIFKLSFFFIIILSFSSCYLVNIVRWGGADMNGYRKFKNLEIHKSNTPFTFHEGKSSTSSFVRIPPDNKNFSSFDDLLNKTKTLSFLIIRNDSILFEKYFNSDEITYYPSFSVSKSFVSALVGIAVDEGYIKNVRQPITDYLTELKGEGFKKITIENLLNMKTGIRFSENYSSPFADVVKYYYGPDLKRYLKHLKVKEEPGKKYDYVSVSSLLLSLIIEKATGKKISDYLEEKIWKPLGMEFKATWSIDSKRHQTVKAFCCLNASSRDFAKLGRLYLNKGKWENKQIISENWIDKSLNYSKDSTAEFYYNYQWRIGNEGDFFAKGALGQFIYVYPHKNIIIVRTANEYGIDNWEKVFRYISKQL
jgi:CubicO group peptidase (beta-lactamase class C family)